MIKKDFKYNIGYTIKDKKRNMTITGTFLKDKNQFSKKYNKYYICKERWYSYICNNCGWDDGEISEHNLDNGNGCRCCGNKIVIQGINDIPTTAPWMVKYFQGGYDEAKLYSKHSNQKIYPICPDCGRVRQKLKIISDIYADHSIGCSCKKGISYPEKFFIKLLEQLNINFIYQVTKAQLSWIGKYRYDFYLPDYNCIIELHGLQHYKDSGTNSVFPTLKETQENDRIKKELAINNNISAYIVVDCRYSNIDFIKASITNNQLLSNIIDFSKCNWYICHMYAEGSMFFKACELKKENPLYSTGDIGKILHLSLSTVYKYLIEGNKLGLCYYNAKEDRTRCSMKNGRKGIYEINVINKDTNSIIATYQSSKILSENSIQDFGVFFNYEQLLKAAKQGNTYKGYKFKYTKDLN